MDFPSIGTPSAAFGCSLIPTFDVTPRRYRRLRPAPPGLAALKTEVREDRMALEESSRNRLYNRLDEVLGPDEARSLMSLLPPVGWADVATKHDLAQLESRIDAKFGTLQSELRAEMFRSILIANSVSLMTMGGLAFAAARLV
jgi:hypothetical protein